MRPALPATQPRDDAATVDGVPTGLLTGLLAALGFLTAVPLPRLGRQTPGRASLGRSVAWFPLVGALLGAVVALADAGLRLGLPHGLAVALLLGLTALLTGGLHWDGLMDACDGLFSGGDAERRLAIMRDSRIGAFGALGLACALLIEWNALVALPAPGRAGWLVVAFVVSRWVLAWLLVAFRYARPAGLGTAFGSAGRVELVVASGVAAAGCALLAGAAGLLALGLGWLLASALAWLACRRVGGLTGDLYGATAQLVEIAVLVIGVRLSEGIG